MKSHIIRISQATPPPPTAAESAPPGPAPSPTPDLGGMGSLGGMPPAAPMGGVSAAPGAPAGPADTFSNGLPFPLENTGMILIDANAEKMIKETASSSSRKGTTSGQEIANKLWEMYGGNKNGGVESGKIGKRKPNTEVDESEIKNTEDKRWERLPEGKTMASLDIPITLLDMQRAVQALEFGTAKAKSKEQAGGGGGLGANSKNKLIKLADTFDKYGFFKLADCIFY